MRHSQAEGLKPGEALLWEHERAEEGGFVKHYAACTFIDHATILDDMRALKVRFLHTAPDASADAGDVRCFAVGSFIRRTDTKMEVIRLLTSVRNLTATL